MGSWADAIATLGTSKARIQFVGDSLLEGQGASAWSRKPTVDLLRRLRARYNRVEAGGVPIQRYYSGGPGSESWATVGSASGGVSADTTHSQSRRGMAIVGANYWLIPAQTAPYRYVEVCYYESTTDGLSGTLTLAENGPVNLLSIDTDAGDGGPKRAIYDYGTSGIRDIGLISYDGLAFGDSIAVHETHPETGPGFAVYDSTGAGQVSSDQASGTASWRGWASAAADLVIDDLWHNDFLAGAATPSVSAARLTARIGRYRAIRADVDVVVMLYWSTAGISETTPNGLGYTFADYRAAIASAAATAGAVVFDLRSLVGTAPASWLASDGVHPNDTGYDQLLTRLDGFLAAQLTGYAGGSVAVVSSTAGDTGTALATTGTVLSTSTSPGSATKRTPANATCAAATTVAGSVAPARSTAGTVAAGSAVAGAVLALSVATGVVPAAAAAAGTPTAVRPTTGTVAATSSTTGTILPPSDTSGQVSAVTSTSGIAAVRTPAAGTVPAASSTVGTASARRPAAGTVLVASAAAGYLTSTGTITPLQVLDVTAHTRRVNITEHRRPVSIQEAR